MIFDFCIPVLNEEKILKNNLLKLYNYLLDKNFDFDWNILVVNNASTDNTEKIIDELSLFDRRIKKINLDKKGKGLAVKSGWQASESDFFVYMDADLAVSLENLELMIEALIEDKADLVFGSRLLPESSTDRSFFRTLSSKSYICLSKFILGHNFSDLQCGFKGAKTAILKDLTLKVEDDNWFFDTELVYAFFYSNRKIKEIPVDWQEERYDQRKSKIRVFRESFIFLNNLVSLRKRYKKENKL